MKQRVSSREAVDSSQQRKVKIPKCRDPFVNARMEYAGVDEQGIERFWCSTWNSTCGTSGLLINEFGEYRIYRFPKRYPGFYSAVYTGDDVMWLCGMLDEIVRLDLNRGDFDTYPTGAPRVLAFQGMCHDPKTGKFLALAHPNDGAYAFSFDSKKLKAARIYQRCCDSYYMRHSFPLGDGTYAVFIVCPGHQLMRWDPVKETFEPFIDIDQFRHKIEHYASFVSDDAGNRFVNGAGWLDCRSGRIVDSEHLPEEEASWFARRGQHVFGYSLGSGHSPTFKKWDMATGQVENLYALPNGSSAYHLTQSGKILTVTIYGDFIRINPDDGFMELSKRLPVEAVQQVDCVCRIDQDRLLGTPFITQRFWEIDLKTGKGCDCGQATPGSGEVLETVKLKNRVYMASYHEGYLVEYDPKKPARFPENPRVVAAPHGANRPKSLTHDGTTICYSCSGKYGKLGSTLTSYNTKTGIVNSVLNPIPDQQIISVDYAKKLKQYLCGTAITADCHSAPPTQDTAVLALVDPETLQVTKQVAMPGKAELVEIDGPLASGKWFCRCACYIDEFTEEGYWRYFVLDETRFEAPQLSELKVVPAWLYSTVYTGIPGKFIFCFRNSVELWDCRKMKRLKTVPNGRGSKRVFVQDRVIYLVKDKDITILENWL